MPAEWLQGCAMFFSYWPWWLVGLVWLSSQSTSVQFCSVRSGISMTGMWIEDCRKETCKIRGWGLLKLHLPSYKHFLQLLSFLQGGGVQCYCSDVALFYTASSWVLSKEMKRRECCQKELYLSLSKYSM